MIINGDGGYRLLAAYIGGPAAQADWLVPKVGGRLAPFLYSSREPSELSQWLCYDDSTTNIVVVIIIIIIIIIIIACRSLKFHGHTLINPLHAPVVFSLDTPTLPFLQNF